MVNPSAVTNYQLDTPTLQAHLIFWIFAAGKNGTRAAEKVNRLINDYVPNGFDLFDCLKNYTLDDLRKVCYNYGTGCHNNKGRTVYELVNSNLNLRTCNCNQLESIFGIGRKTSRCFIMHSRKGARCAGLDTHILKFLIIMGVSGVPKTTPSTKKQYERLEKEFLILSDKYNKEPAELDLLVWNEFKRY